jgi:hypothetical protein
VSPSRVSALSALTFAPDKKSGIPAKATLFQDRKSNLVKTLEAKAKATIPKKAAPKTTKAAPTAPVFQRSKMAYFAHAIYPATPAGLKEIKNVMAALEKAGWVIVVRDKNPYRALRGQFNGPAKQLLMGLPLKEGETVTPERAEKLRAFALQTIESGYRKVWDNQVVIRDIVDRPVTGERKHNRSTAPVGPGFEEDVSELIDASRQAAQGFQTNPAMRKAVERYAIERARRHYEKRGFEVDEYGRPFDLQCRKGRSVLYVEVKGTQTTGAEIILTPNEVDFAQKNRMELFVLHSVKVGLRGKGFVATSGVERVVSPWRPQLAELKPLAFSCTIG